MNAPQMPAAALSRTVSDEARRPLFLGGGLRGWVDLDGPGLRVRSERLASARYPLARVSRVIASSGMNWSAGALRACLEGGIPIVIVAEDGTPLGCIYPARPHVSRLAEALDEMLDRPDWAELYGCWLRAMRMRLLLQWRAGREAEGESADPAAFRELVRRLAYEGKPGGDIPPIRGFCQGAVRALAAQTLRRWSLKPVFIAGGGGSLDLLGDLSGLLELRLGLEIGPAMQQTLEDEAFALRVLHTASARLETLADDTIRRLARRVREVLAEWR